MQLSALIRHGDGDLMLALSGSPCGKVHGVAESPARAIAAGCWLQLSMEAGMRGGCVCHSTWQLCKPSSLQTSLGPTATMPARCHTTAAPKHAWPVVMGSSRTHPAPAPMHQQLCMRLSHGPWLQAWQQAGCHPAGQLQHSPMVYPPCHQPPSTAPRVRRRRDAGGHTRAAHPTAIESPAGGALCQARSQDTLLSVPVDEQPIFAARRRDVSDGRQSHAHTTACPTHQPEPAPERAREAARMGCTQLCGLAMAQQARQAPQHPRAALAPTPVVVPSHSHVQLPGSWHWRQSWERGAGARCWWRRRPGPPSTGNLQAGHTLPSCHTAAAAAREPRVPWQQHTTPRSPHRVRHLHGTRPSHTQQRWQWGRAQQYHIRLCRGGFRRRGPSIFLHGPFIFLHEPFVFLPALLTRAAGPCGAEAGAAGAPGARVSQGGPSGGRTSRCRQQRQVHAAVASGVQAARPWEGRDYEIAPPTQGSYLAAAGQVFPGQPAPRASPAVTATVRSRRCQRRPCLQLLSPSCTTQKLWRDRGLVRVMQHRHWEQRSCPRGLQPLQFPGPS